MKKYKKYGLAFAIPFLLSCFICIANGVYPFGDNCILHVDMYHQYCPFFSEFLNKLQSGSSLMYTWKEGLGSDFVSLYAYYLASPFNWLLLFCPAGYVIEFMTVTILIKIGLCGLFMYLYLEGHYGTASRGPYAIFVFSTAYALSGFVAAYSWNIMWMDSVALAPLVVLGLERLVEKNQVALYYVTLAISIWSNYYIAMILCIFLILYFVLLLMESKGGQIQACLRFAFYSLLAGGTSAVLLIPEAIVLSYSGSSGVRLPKSVEWYFSLLEEYGRGCTAASVYTGGNHWPNLYAGAFSLLLFALYVCNGRIPLKRKISRLFMVALLFVSFSNNALDFIWHGLHFPSSLPGRQSFVYIFVVLLLGYEVILAWEGITPFKIVLGGGVVLLLLGMSAAVADDTVTDSLAFVMTGLFVVCYMILALLTKLVSEDMYRWIRMFCILIAIAELTLNMAVTGFYTTGRRPYVAKMDDYHALLQMAKEKEADEGNLFYRVEDLQRKTKNDSALYGYSSATEFSSLMNIHISHFYQRLAMEGGKNFYCYNGSTPLTSAMLSVKYCLLDHALEDGELRTLIASSNHQYLYENNFFLPLGFMIPQDVVNRWDNADSVGVNNLNQLGRLLGAADDMLSLVTCVQEVEEGSTKIIPNEGGIYYASYVTCSSDTLDLLTDTNRKRRFSKTTHRYLLELGECHQDGYFKISNKKNERISFRMYRLNLDAVKQAYATLAEQTMELTHFSDTKIEGLIDVTREGSLMLSIPSQQGWTLYVDDVLTDITSWKDAWIAVSLDKGKHKISLKYRTPGLISGAVISGMCIVIFGLSYGIRRKKK